MSRSDRPEVIAHRGASAYAPENTLAAFSLALRLGADCLELDVRTTADGVPVVLHDPTLERTTGLDREVTDLTTAELAALPRDVRPPRLDTILDAFGASTDYLVEIKRIPVDAEASLLEAFAARGLRSRVTVQSFDHVLLRRLRRRDGALRLAALFRPEADAESSTDLVAPFVDGIGPAAGQVDEALIEHARRRGVRVRAWTVNEPAEMRRLLSLGVDGIITDRPERARAVVSAAGRSAPAARAQSAPAGARQARMAATSPA